MSLLRGTRFGHYEIDAPIGSGGMGEVYRARDTRLDRTVAIKILPPRLAQDPARRERFEREGRAIAKLSHPHICTLFDIGEELGTSFLVLEYLEGQTLADRLKRGPLPLDHVLWYGMEIADALERVHRIGIVHRDLKPRNVMLTASGVKLLDFGLAKQRLARNRDEMKGLSDLPTKSEFSTEDDVVPGTLQYMSTEQLEGKEADSRTDIFALGSVLYEMATGKKAFEGSSPATVIGAILPVEPKPLECPEPVPPALDHVIRTCLAKDPEARWQSALDVYLELKWISERGVQATALAAPSRHRLPGRLLWGFVTAFAAISIWLGASLLERSDVTSGRVLRFPVLAPAKTAFSSSGSMALSPDGSRIVFAATGPDGRTLLWAQQLDSLDARPLSGSDEATLPFWSPDGRFVAFFAQGKLKKIDATGGGPQVLCDAEEGRGGAWSESGIIVFSPATRGPLERVSDAGGPSTQVTQLRSGESSHRWPAFLPDGRHLLYFAVTEKPESAAVFVASLDVPEGRLLLSAESGASVVPPDHLLFVRGQSLVAQAFDAQKLTLGKIAHTLAEGLGVSRTATGYASVSVSQNGFLAYRNLDEETKELTWFDREGRTLGVVGPPGFYFAPALSPDGKRVALRKIDPPTATSDVWTIEISRGVLSRLTFDPSIKSTPLYSPDGARVVFAANRKGHFDLYAKPATGGGTDEVVWESDAEKFPLDWSPDGRHLLVQVQSPERKSALWLVPLGTSEKPAPLLDREYVETQGRFSPAGRYLAYASDETGRAEVYVQTLPPSGGKWQVSTNGGSQPQWRRDGKELFYLGADRRLFALDVRTDGVFAAGSPRPLFEAPLPPSSLLDFRNQYVVSPEGDRFLLTVTVEGASRAPITVVSNWPGEIPK